MPIWGKIISLNRICREINSRNSIVGFIPVAPPKPSKKEVPEILGKTTTSVKLQFKKGLFSDENGQVVYRQSPLHFTSQLIYFIFCCRLLAIPSSQVRTKIKTLQLWKRPYFCGGKTYRVITSGLHIRYIVLSL